MCRVSDRKWLIYFFVSCFCVVFVCLFEVVNLFGVESSWADSGSRSRVNESRINPLYASWASHEPGTYIVIQSSVSTGRAKAKSVTKTTLIEKNAEEVILENQLSTIESGNKVAMPPSRFTIRALLAAPAPQAVSGDASAKIRREIVQVYGKIAVDCEVTDSSVSIAGLKTASTVWTNGEVPGLTVRSVSKTIGAVNSESELKLIAMELR